MENMVSATLKHIMWRALGYATHLKHEIAKYYAWFVPSYVMNVWHLDGSYNASHHNFVFEEYGYYVIHYWYALAREVRKVCISAKLLKDALGITSLYRWSAFSEEGKCLSLASFFNAQSPHSRIFAIHIGGKDVTHVLKPYIDSVTLDSNLTAKAVCELYYFLVGDPKGEENTVMITNFDLEERTFTRDEYLFPSKL